jgi:hypothetical protein
MANKRSKEGKKGCRRRTPKYTNPAKAATRNLRSEINKTEKKVEKLLRLYTEGRQKKNQLWSVRAEDGSVEKHVLGKKPRLQGIRRDGEHHKKLLNHLKRLQARLREL